MKKPDRVMAIGQTIALVTVNQCVKFKDSSFNGIEVMGRLKFFTSTTTPTAMPGS